MVKRSRAYYVRDFEDYNNVNRSLTDSERFQVLFQFYLKQGDEFRRLKKSSAKLRAQYQILYNIFDGNEYTGDGPDDDELIETMRDLPRLRERPDLVRLLDRIFPRSDSN